MPVKREIRLGKVSYLNTIPVYYAWEKGLVQGDDIPIRVITGTPSELNRMLSKGEVDISVVSSVEYAINQEDYLLVPGLCIGAIEEVKSVLFFSKRPLDKLNDTDVWITLSSLTSSTLVQFILEDDIGISPKYRRFKLGDKKDCSPEAMLLIGDEALKEKKRGRYPYVVDLSAYWWRRHRLPFVFAVWCVRNDVWQECPNQVQEVCRTLLASSRMGRLLINEIARQHHACVGLTQEECIDYLKGLSFSLTEEHLKGMELFFELITRKGIVPQRPKIRFVELDHHV